MVQLIVGKKGKGKTKQLLDKVNGAIKAAEGNIVYLDKSSKHMYELNNKIRLIDVPDIRLKMQMNSSVLYVVLYLRIMIFRKCIWTAS